MLLLKHVMHRSTLRTFSYILWKRILWIFSVPSLDIADFLPPTRWAALRAFKFDPARFVCGNYIFTT